MRRHLLSVIYAAGAAWGAFSTLCAMWYSDTPMAAAFFLGMGSVYVSACCIAATATFKGE